MNQSKSPQPQDSFKGKELAPDLSSGIIESAAEGMVVLNAQDEIVLWNPFMEKLLGLDQKEAIAQGFVALFPLAIRERLYQILRDIRAGEIQEKIKLFCGSSPEKTATHLLASGAMLRNAPPGFIVLLFRDWTSEIKDREELHARIDDLSESLGQLGVEHVQLWETSEELETLAIYDELTKLYNRRYLGIRGKEEYARVIRYQLPFGLLMMDLDHFKSVNDELGHPFGDVVLSQGGQMIKQAIRETDIPIRFGGEEFVILVPETPTEGLMVLAERIRTLFENHVFIHEGITRKVTISIGGVDIPPYRFENLDKMLEEADRALYEAKKERNCSVIR